MFLLRKLETNHKLDSENIIEFLEGTYETRISKRTAQRYMNDLCELDTRVETHQEGKKKVLKIVKRGGNVSTPFIDSKENYLVAVNMLKAHLTSFKDTKLEDKIDKLQNYLDTEYPEDIISPEALYWDQNIGKYKYYEDSKQRKTINKITDFIVEKKEAYIKYNSPGNEDTSKFKTFFRQFFQYDGALYVAAYVPYYDSHVALAVHFIDDIEESKRHRTAEELSLPPFDFREFTKERFGVFEGKSKKVVLEVMDGYKKYFQNRQFHQTQKNFNEKGEKRNMVINMKVPLSPELVGWILKWGGGLKVRKPEKLKKMVKEKAEELLEVNS